MAEGIANKAIVVLAPTRHPKWCPGLNSIHRDFAVDFVGDALLAIVFTKGFKEQSHKHGCYLLGGMGLWCPASDMMWVHWGHLCPGAPAAATNQERKGFSTLCLNWHIWTVGICLALTMAESVVSRSWQLISKHTDFWSIGFGVKNWLNSECRLTVFQPGCHRCPKYN